MKFQILAVCLALAVVQVMAQTTPIPTPSPTVDCSAYNTQTTCNNQIGCTWDNNRCKNWIDDVAKGLATFVIILIVIGVLITIGIIACIVCCCCMGASAMRGKDTVVVHQQGQQQGSYQNL